MNNFDNENYHKNILEERAANKPRHSPLPWQIMASDKRVTPHFVSIYGADGVVIGEILLGRPNDAAFIVEACNNYEKLQQTNADLVKALEEYGGS